MFGYFPPSIASEALVGPFAAVFSLLVTPDGSAAFKEYLGGVFMPESVLDPYREEILALHHSGHTQADIKRRLEAEHGVTIGRTRVSEFLKPASR